MRILSIDGGGIRGIISALAEIERRPGRPAAGLFDLIAGTSAGGIPLGSWPNSNDKDSTAAGSTVSGGPEDAQLASAAASGSCGKAVALRVALVLFEAG